MFDSVNAVLENTSSLKEKSIACDEAARNHFSENPTRAMEYSFKGLKYAKEAGYKEGIISNSLFISIYYIEIDSLTEAFEILTDLEFIEDQFWNNQFRTSYHIYRALLYEFGGDYSMAIEENLLAVEYSNQSKDTSKMGSSLNNLAVVYSLSGENELAVKTQKKALNCFMVVGNYNYATNSYINLANWKSDLQEYDSAMYFIAIAEKRLLQSHDNYGIIHAYDVRAHLFLRQEEPDSAILYFRKCRRIIRVEDEVPFSATYEINLFYGLGLSHSKKEILDSAKFYTQQALVLSDGYDRYRRTEILKLLSDIELSKRRL